MLAVVELIQVFFCLIQDFGFVCVLSKNYLLLLLQVIRHHALLLQVLFLDCSSLLELSGLQLPNLGLQLKDVLLQLEILVLISFAVSNDRDQVKGWISHEQHVNIGIIRFIIIDFHQLVHFFLDPLGHLLLLF